MTTLSLSRSLSLSLALSRSLSRSPSLYLSEDFINIREQNQDQGSCSGRTDLKILPKSPFHDRRLASYKMPLSKVTYAFINAQLLSSRSRHQPHPPTAHSHPGNAYTSPASASHPTNSLDADNKLYAAPPTPQAPSNPYIRGLDPVQIQVACGDLRYTAGCHLRCRVYLRGELSSSGQRGVDARFEGLKRGIRGLICEDFSTRLVRDGFRFFKGKMYRLCSEGCGVHGGYIFLCSNPMGSAALWEDSSMIRSR